MGVGGYRVITPGERALSCADIAVGDKVEIDGRGTYRIGHVVEKGETTSRSPRTAPTSPA